MEPAILIYDGECPVCQGARDWIAANAAPGAFRFLPCQDPERPQVAPALAYEDCMREIYVVLPGGETVAGVKAFPHIFQRLTRYRWLGRLLRVPGVSLIAPVFYRMFARNRMTISNFFWRKSAKNSCDRDGGCR